MYPLFYLLLWATSGCSTPQTINPAAPPNAPDIMDLLDGAFDPQLAASLKADEYGMKRYVLAFLKAGPNRDQSEDEAARLQQAHLANIRRLADEGSLVLAGPFMDDGDVRGIYIFAIETLEEARTLTATDPAIQSGRLQMELHPWYGPAALGLVHGLQQKVTQTPI